MSRLINGVMAGVAAAVVAACVSDRPLVVDGFMEQAAWESVSGTLSAEQGGTFVQVQVPPTFGDDAALRQVAQRLADLLSGEIG